MIIIHIQSTHTHIKVIFVTRHKIRKINSKISYRLKIIKMDFSHDLCGVACIFGVYLFNTGLN